MLTCENRELRSGKFILTFDVSDFTDTITVKMFIRPELFDEVKAVISPGIFIRVKGVTTIDKFDGELTLGSIVGIKKPMILPASAWTTAWIRESSCTAIPR